MFSFPIVAWPAPSSIDVLYQFHMHHPVLFTFPKKSGILKPGLVRLPPYHVPKMVDPIMADILNPLLPNPPDHKAILDDRRKHCLQIISIKKHHNDDHYHDAGPPHDNKEKRVRFLLE